MIQDILTPGNFKKAAVTFKISFFSRQEAYIKKPHIIIKNILSSSPFEWAGVPFFQAFKLLLFKTHNL